MESIKGLKYRKHMQLSNVDIVDGTFSIGDAAFSFCTSLKKVVIPSSIIFIGVAAFCSSGLEEITFLGTPKLIESSAFLGCKHLKRIIVPKGAKERFCKMLDVDESIIVEQSESSLLVEEEYVVNVKEPEPIQKTLRKTTFSYNFNQFEWKCGDEVHLDELFSGPTTLIGNPSYQFRRKALFVFMQSNIANQLRVEAEYEIPANTGVFMRKYQEKYSSKLPRIFLFVCDDRKVASFYDEVQMVRANKNSITIKSLLRV
jgi:hypothetical protein